MSETSSKLTTALQAAQARQSSVSTNPSALSEGLVRKQEIPQIDFEAETAQALDTLETEVVKYRDRAETPNMELINAKQAVVLLEAQLDEARKHLAEMETRGSWLDQLNQAVSVSERRVATT